jgi:hypothetical protein
MARTVPRAILASARFGRVLGWGLGVKEVAGRPTHTLAWRAYVARKVPLADLAPHDRIPPVIDGQATDVIAYAPTQAARGAARTMPPGTRIVNARGVPGTLGCCAWTRDTAERVLVGSWHVLFGEGARSGDGIYIVQEGQPQYALIAHARGGTLGPVAYDGATYHVDAAIALCREDAARRRLNPPNPVSPRSACWASAGDVVHMHGAASGTTSGIVVDVAYPDLAMIEGRPIDAPGQILVRPAEGDAVAPFAAIGDSGAVLIDSNARAVGLLWGSNGRGEGIACHLLPALEALNVTLALSWRDRWGRLMRRIRRGRS